MTQNTANSANQEDYKKTKQGLIISLINILKWQVVNKIRKCVKDTIFSGNIVLSLYFMTQVKLETNISRCNTIDYIHP